MLTFYKTYNDDSILPQLVAKLPWGHNILLIEKIKDRKIRFWYALQCIENGWSRDSLEMQIKSQLHQRQGEPLKVEISGVANGVVSGVVKPVYDFIAQNEGCRKPLIAKHIKIPIKTVDKHIAKLREMNKTIFVGAPKTGGYFIITDV